ncbi:MAG: hypothetical protein IT337_04725 [Thermomicrobiales bacterium]|nr:hypothetical protein [Thermomicrobiales bacterium]
MTNVFAVVGESHADPTRLLLQGADGAYYAYTRDGRLVRVNPVDGWRLDADTTERGRPDAEPGKPRRIAS